MAKGVVDRAEPVQIENRHRYGTAGTRRITDRLGETLLEEGPVRKSRQRVVSGEILQTRVHFLDLSRVALGAQLEFSAIHGDDVSHRQNRERERRQRDGQELHVARRADAAERAEDQMPVFQRETVQPDDRSRPGECSRALLQRGERRARLSGPDEKRECRRTKQENKHERRGE